MTELVKSQINIICTMCLCGVAEGLMYNAAHTLIRVWGIKTKGRAAIKFVYFLCAGFLAGEAFYFCSYGKITFLGTGSLLCGLWLWKMIFCDILTPIGGSYGKEKG